LLEFFAKHDFQLSGTAARRTHLIRTMCRRICGTQQKSEFDGGEATLLALHASHHCGYAGNQIIS